MRNTSSARAAGLETSGLTRDGVEVVPNISVTFRLERTPGDEDLSFGFNPGSVEAWVRAEGIAQARSLDAKKIAGAAPWGIPAFACLAQETAGLPGSRCVARVLAEVHPGRALPLAPGRRTRRAIPVWR